MVQCKCSNGMTGGKLGYLKNLFQMHKVFYPASVRSEIPGTELSQTTRLTGDFPITYPPTNARQ